MEIKYSPDARDRLRQIKTTIGAHVSSNIVKAINGLEDNPRKCPSVENILGIPSLYFFLHIENHYIFYRIASMTIYVTAIYNEKEDFMWKMFGIRLRTQESIDYWGE